MLAQTASLLPPEAADPAVHQQRLWTETALRLGFINFLSPEDGFRSCTRTGRVWSGRAQPGIYFWLAANGEAYVGQSLKPQARLRQHIKSHEDLLYAAFRPCQSEELNRIEARLVHEIGDQLPLRNIKLAVSTASEEPLDQFVSPQEQEVFLLGDGLPNSNRRLLEKCSLTRLFRDPPLSVC